MSTIADISPSLAMPNRAIYEPLDAPNTLAPVLGRFGENYNTSPTSHLYRFLVALCGDAGAGSLKRGMLYAKLQSSIEATQFSDLDRLYGNILGLQRLPNEI